jgi:hypothetical protein
MLELFTTDSVTVHNEWAKITATFWNNAAVGAFGAGVVLPLFPISRKSCRIVRSSL